MAKKGYAPASVVSLGSFKENTNGVWFGKFRDIFGGKAVIKIEW